MSKITKNKYTIFLSILVFFYFSTISFYKAEFILFEEFYFEIYFEVLNLKFFITTGIAGCVILATMLIQKFINNSMASPSILGLSQINFIIYAILLLISADVFYSVFNSAKINNLIIQIVIYTSFSFCFSVFIIWLTKDLKSNYIVTIGIIFNILFSSITIIIMQQLRIHDSEFDIIYAKMMGKFISPTPNASLFKMNGPKFMAVISNIASIVGIIIMKKYYYNITKNELLVNRFGITNRKRLVTRVCLVLLISFYTAIVFIMAGVVSFFTIGIMLLTKLIFGDNEYDNFLLYFLIAIASLVAIDWIIDNLIMKYLVFDIAKGVFASLITIPILVVSLLKKRGVND